MKRKLLICAIAVLLTVAIILVCTFVPFKYEVFVLNVKEHYGLSKRDIIQAGSHFYERDKAPKTITYDINGTVYELEYIESIDREQLFDTSMDVYRYSDDIMYISVFKNQKNGEVVLYSYSYKDDTADSPKLDRDECLKIGEDYLNKKHKDYFEYELVKESFLTRDESYYFYFTKVTNGIKSSEYIELTVSDRGEVTGYLKKFLGKMSYKKIPSEKEIAFIEKKLDDKIRSIYEGYVYEYMYTIEDVEYTRFRDGRYALKYDILLRMHEEPSEYKLEDAAPRPFSYLVYL